MLVIYSDGVSEACNPSGEEFGPTRLYEVVARNLDASAGGIRDRIESALTKFCQGTPAADDITLVICKRLAETVGVLAAAKVRPGTALLSLEYIDLSPLC